MNEFDFWQEWGLELDDRQFANAFLVLGVLAARSAPGGGPARDLREALSAALKFSEEINGLLSWRFPVRDQPSGVGNKKALLTDLDPRQVADAWKDAPTIIKTAPRLQVLGGPPGEQVTPWFRMLFEADPAAAAAHIVLETPQWPHLRWPFRIGYLDGNSGEAIVKSIAAKRPSDSLTQALRIDRDNANCDILVFSGGSRELLRALLDMPGSQKSNLVVIRGRIEDDTTPVDQRLAALSSETSASGYVFLHPDTSDEVMSLALNRFIENLSRNRPMDIALSEALTKGQKTDPTIFLSHQLADIKMMDHIVQAMCGSLRELPKTARPMITGATFDRMGLNVRMVGHSLRDPQRVATVLTKHRSAIRFDADNSGALAMAEISSAVREAERGSRETTPHERYLQERVFIKKQAKFVEARRAFQTGVPTLVRVRVGPRDAKWTGLGVRVPEEKLPKDVDEWRLTVVLTEPNHLKGPLMRFIKLPKSGASTECRFRVQPTDYPVFEGRITILHRGRVLQTGVLKGKVVKDEAEIVADDAITFTEVLAVRSHMGDLERRHFDLAFVVNHSAGKRPGLQAIATNHAWIADLSTCKETAGKINTLLSEVASSVKDYASGLESDNGRSLLVKLAEEGHRLYDYIVTDQLEKATNLSEMAKKEYVQIVSTRVEALTPFEFIYDFDSPDDDAALCPKWRESLTKGSCKEANCDALPGKVHCKTVCPLGFWGVRKVIERHALTPEFASGGMQGFLQSEPTSGRNVLPLSGTAIVAASTRVKTDMLAPVLAACADRFGSPPQEAKDWDQWAEFVQNFKPRVLLALPHTDGSGVEATLEIGGEPIKSIHIKKNHVQAQGDETYPLVALLGCDTTGTAQEYGSAVADFRRRGAGVVIGTIATVFGEHAAKVAEMLVNGLTPDSQQPAPGGKKLERLGEVIRLLKRQALLDGLLMALCVVAFGDADWKLAGKES